MREKKKESKFYYFAVIESNRPNVFNSRARYHQETQPAVYYWLFRMFYGRNWRKPIFGMMSIRVISRKSLFLFRSPSYVSSLSRSFFRLCSTVQQYNENLRFLKIGISPNDDLTRAKRASKHVLAKYFLQECSRRDQRLTYNSSLKRVGEGCWSLPISLMYKNWFSSKYANSVLGSREDEKMFSLTQFVSNKEGANGHSLSISKRIVRRRKVYLQIFQAILLLLNFGYWGRSFQFF